MWCTGLLTAPKELNWQTYRIGRCMWQTNWQTHGIDYDSPLADIKTDNNVVVPCRVTQPAYRSPTAGITS